MTAPEPANTQVSGPALPASSRPFGPVLGVAALLLVPVLAGVFVFASPPRRPQVSPRSWVASASSPVTRDKTSSNRHSSPHLLTNHRGVPARTGVTPSPVTSPLLGADPDPEPEEEATDPEEDARHLDHFISNAEAFDQMSRVFAAEIRTGKTAERVEARWQGPLQGDVSRLAPGSSPRLRCTTSVCEVVVTSPQPVGMLLADLGPWLSQHQRGATGDVEDSPEDSPEGFRLLIQVEDLEANDPGP